MQMKKAAEIFCGFFYCPGLELNQHGVLTPSGPQPDASANSATWASKERHIIRAFPDSARFLFWGWIAGRFIEKAGYRASSQCCASTENSYRSIVQFSSRSNPAIAVQLFS